MRNCPQIFYVGQNCMTMLTDWTAKDRDDIEFQLKRIKSAKSMLNDREKELKKQLKEFERFHVGEELLCKKITLMDLQKIRRLLLENRLFL